MFSNIFVCFFTQDERDKMKKLLEDAGIPVPESEKLLLLVCMCVRALCVPVCVHCVHNGYCVCVCTLYT